MISAADIKADRTVWRLALIAARLANTVLGANFRWQHLPVPFEMYADGIDLVVFEEFGSGAAALNVRDELARGELLADEVTGAPSAKTWPSGSDRGCGTATSTTHR